MRRNRLGVAWTTNFGFVLPQAFAGTSVTPVEALWVRPIAPHAPVEPVNPAVSPLMATIADDAFKNTEAELRPPFKEA